MERNPVELTACIHIEEGRCWAEVSELPGCFAAGDTLGELFESLQEGIALYLADQTSFHVDAEAWQEIATAIDRPAQARPELVKLFTRPRPD
jgi:predicted RNase H-like HicB family nuclease